MYATGDEQKRIKKRKPNKMKDIIIENKNKRDQNYLSRYDARYYLQ